MMSRTATVQDKLVKYLHEKTDNWIPKMAISTTIVRNRLKTAGYRAWKPIKRLLLNQHAKQNVRHGVRWNLVSWRKIYWSNESRLFLHMTRVWRQPNTAYAASNIQETIPFVDGSVRGVISHDGKLDLVTIQSNLNRPRNNCTCKKEHPVNYWCPSCWQPQNQCLWTTMLDPHQMRAVMDFLQRNAIITIPWPARNPDLNSVKNLWGILWRRLRQRQPRPKCRTIVSRTPELTSDPGHRKTYWSGHSCRWGLHQIMIF